MLLRSDKRRTFASVPRRTFAVFRDAGCARGLDKTDRKEAERIIAALKCSNAPMSGGDDVISTPSKNQNLLLYFVVLLGNAGTT